MFRFRLHNVNLQSGIDFARHLVNEYKLELSAAHRAINDISRSEGAIVEIHEDKILENHQDPQQLIPFPQRIIDDCEKWGLNAVQVL